MGAPKINKCYPSIHGGWQMNSLKLDHHSFVIAGRGPAYSGPQN